MGSGTLSIIRVRFSVPQSRDWPDCLSSLELLCGGCLLLPPGHRRHAPVPGDCRRCRRFRRVFGDAQERRYKKPMTILSSFLMVGERVFHLFLMSVAGFILGRARLLDERGAYGLNNVLLYVGLPCMLLSAFQKAPEDGGLSNFFLATLLAAAIHVISILIAHLTIHHENRQQETVFRLAASMCNCGFMAMPLQSSLLGSIGVFYGSAYSMVFNLFSWTYALTMMSGSRKGFSVRRLILNPGIMGVIVSLTLYLLHVRLPSLLLTPVTYLGELTITLPMLIIGYQLSQVNFSFVLKRSGFWISAALRLLVFPALALGLCILLRMDRTLLLTMVIAASTPAAAVINMFALRFNGDSKLASSTVAVSTVLSCLTIPLMVGLAMALVP